MADEKGGPKWNFNGNFVKLTVEAITWRRDAMLWCSWGRTRRHSRLKPITKTVSSLQYMTSDQSLRSTRKSSYKADAPNPWTMCIGFENALGLVWKQTSLLPVASNIEWALLLSRSSCHSFPVTFVFRGWLSSTHAVSSGTSKSSETGASFFPCPKPRYIRYEEKTSKHVGKVESPTSAPQSFVFTLSFSFFSRSHSPPCDPCYRMLLDSRLPETNSNIKKERKSSRICG